MKFEKVRIECHKNRVRYDRTCYGALRYHNRNESDLHWKVKAMLLKRLLDKGYSVFSEFPLDQGVADIYVLDTNQVIEVQTRIDNEIRKAKVEQFQNRDVWIIPAKEFENDFEHALDYWIEKLGV